MTPCWGRGEGAARADWPVGRVTVVAGRQRNGALSVVLAAQGSTQGTLRNSRSTARPASYFNADPPFERQSTAGDVPAALVVGHNDHDGGLITNDLTEPAVNCLWYPRLHRGAALRLPRPPVRCWSRASERFPELTLAAVRRREGR
jgi:hypothetical protein